ncbi:MULTISPECIES: hypothetical protein [Amycolatopsis]|uniref:DUF7736 domain-containing protein n=1 Tax=Amycolatopsis dongchuanensis TaxID=1070866 RepID=A0ABP9Q1D3_9PSEU
MSRRFHLGDLLSVTTGKLLSSNGYAGVQALVEYVTGQAHLTHQLSRAVEEIRPFLLQQHPWLADANIPRDVGDRFDLLCWFAWAKEEWGEWHQVEPMPFGQYVGREPIAELQEMNPNAEIIRPDELP